MDAANQSMRAAGQPEVRSSGLTRRNIKTLALIAVGASLESYDFKVFVFFAAVLGQVFFPPDMPVWLAQAQAFAIFAAGFLVRPIGGVFIAHFGDRYGRKKLFMLTLFLMAAPTVVLALLPTYAVVGMWAPVFLLLVRLLQGVAMGGEVPGAVVFAVEHAGRNNVGLSGATLFCGLNIGLFLGALVGALLASYLPHAALFSYGWRIAFGVGGVFGFVALYLRRHLHESELFEKIKKTKQLSARIPVVEVLRNHMPAVLFVVCLAIVLCCVNAVMFQYLVTYLQTTQTLPKSDVFVADTAAILVLSLMCPAWGWLGDRIGLGRALALGCVCVAAAAIWFFARLHAGAISRTDLMINWIIVAIPGGFIGLIPGMSAAAFPTSVRFTGVSLPYNIATAIFAGLMPLFLTFMVHLFGSLAPGFACVVGCVFGLPVAWWARKFTWKDDAEVTRNND